MSGFQGSTSDSTRNSVQVKFSNAIGNESTKARSVDLAVRVENALFDRMGKSADREYKRKYKELIQLLKDPKEGFHLNQKLLTGMLTPEKWVEEQIPEKRPEVVKMSSKSEKKSGEEVAAATARAIASASKNKKSEETNKKVEVSKDASSQNNNSSEPKKSKVEASSYYFFSSTPAEKAAKYAPKKIEKKEPEKPAPENGPKLVSKWNTAATWEERDVSKWACQKLKEMLCDISVPEFDGICEINNDWKVTGEASVVFSRGKIRPGYEMKIETKVKGSFKGESVKGKILIPNFNNIDGEDYSIKYQFNENNEATAVIRRATKKVDEEIRERFKKFVEELKKA